MVILIILATVTISAVFDENGLIKQAQKTKESAENFVQGEDEEMNKLLQEYANMMEEDVEIPEPEIDSTPLVVTVTAGGTTTNSITVSVQAVDNESGMVTSPKYTYYIKKSNEGDGSYQAKATNITNASYTFTGLEQETSYDIKVEVNGDNAGNVGTGTLTGQVTTKVPAEGAITFGSTTWSGGQASITVSTNTGMQIQYQVNSTSGSWTNISNNGTVGNLQHGQTVYARLYDGTNYGDYASASIVDGIKPTVSSITTGTITSNSIQVTVSASDGQSGLATSGTYKYYLNGTLKSTQTSSSYTFEGLTGETQYTIKVEAFDKAGNKGELILNEKTIIETIENAKLNKTVFDSKTILEDRKRNKITVPKGFKIASDSGNTVQEGIVIEDVSASTDKNVQGSQFVWIPVGFFMKDDNTLSNEIILGRYDFTENGIADLKQAAYTMDNQNNYMSVVYISKSYEKTDYREGIETYENGENATAYDLKSWIDSARENGGYYIARYEASFASGSSNYEESKAASKKSIGCSTANMSFVSGKLWNFITQQSASKVAINTYSDSDSVKSDLINSYAWDTAIVFIQESGNSNYSNQAGQTINSVIANTGTKQDEVCKINDMASNLIEWSTEYCSMYPPMGPECWPCIPRGGGYTYKQTGLGARQTKSRLPEGAATGDRISRR